MQLVEPSVIRRARDRQHDEGVAHRRLSQRVDHDPGARLGQALEVRRQLAPVGELAVRSDVEAEVIPGRRDALSAEMWRCEYDGHEGRNEPASQLRTPPTPRKHTSEDRGCTMSMNRGLEPHRPGNEPRWYRSSSGAATDVYRRRGTLLRPSAAGTPRGSRDLICGDRVGVALRTTTE